LFYVIINKHHLTVNQFDAALRNHTISETFYLPVIYFDSQIIAYLLINTNMRPNVTPEKN